MLLHIPYSAIQTRRPCKVHHPRSKCALGMVGANAARGFTLLETMVAMLILATALVVMLQLLSEGLKSSRLAGEYTRAVFHAREIMEAVLLKSPLQDESQEGTFEDGYRWRYLVTLIEEEVEPERTPPMEQYHITVKISWPENSTGKDIELSTLKIQPRSTDTS